MNNSTNISIRKMAKLLKKFHINNGDILALKSKVDFSTKDTVEAIATALGRMGLTEALVVVVEDFDDMTVLNETEMNKRGWFKLESVMKLMKRTKKEAEQ